MQFRYLGALMLCVLGCSSEGDKVSNGNYALILQGVLDEKVPALTIEEALGWKGNILDTRTKAEYDISHIPKAIWVGEPPLDSSRLAGIDLGLPTLFYCSIGYRSEEATRYVRDKGVDSVFNLYGGIFEWSNQGHPLQKDGGYVTDTLHGYSPIWGNWVERGTVVYEPDPGS